MTKYSSDPGTKPELKWIEVGKLFVDHSYQRNTKSRASEKNLDYLKTSFSWAHCGALIVCYVKPVRIQRRRIAGYDMQAASFARNGLACISVVRPGRWGNPYDVRKYGRQLSLAVFRNTAWGIWSPGPVASQSDEVCDAIYAEHHAWLRRLGAHPLELMRSELRGHNLACFCRLSDDCHADIYLTLLSES